MSDHNSNVYIAATANDIKSLPTEFCRKGRFDEIFGLDLPDVLERKEIFNIHIKKRNRNPDNYDKDNFAIKTGSLTGADIEQTIKVALKLAFRENLELQDKHLERAISSIIPLSRTEPERIEAMRKWISAHAKKSSNQEPIKQRKLSI